MIFSIIKRLISTTFDKKGVFETIWLSIIHWHKLKVPNVRSLLKFNKEEDEFDPQHIMRQSIKSSLQNKHSPEEAQQITKYATKAGFNIELTSSGIKQEEEVRPQLTVQKAPFLPLREIGDSQYCLVLDLDETLIHYVENGADSYFLVRPFCVEFLAELSQYYEIVVFTAGV